MLAYLLAIVIALGSFSFYMAAFFVPEVHRRQDFVWSGVGMFYALVLWFCAGRITGAVLLGQVASVGLLSWLGFQTLELRRALTPESVRTPTDWADVQRWLQMARQTLSQYVKMGSLLEGASAALADASGALAALKNRIAGPRGKQDAISTVPPLKRSPAYEFETEAGQGEAIPSEFATVAPQEAQKTEQGDSVTKPLALETSPSSGLSSTPRTTEDEATATRSIVDAVPTEGKAAATSQPEIPSSTPTPTKRPQLGQQQPVTTTPVSSKRPKTRATNPITGLGLWVRDVVGSLRKPKPQRAVIEIPPRPPSIRRSGDATKPPSQGTVPPVSIPQPASTPEPETNWVDMGDRENEPSSRSPDIDSTSASDPTFVSKPAPKSTPDLESNWIEIEQGSSIEVPPAAPATPSETPETNWPDDEADKQNSFTEPAPSHSSDELDEDSNWPD